jgi:predicted type IV restriction endonuclease
MTNKQTAQYKIASLVTRFEEQYQSYKHSDYNETLTRRDFIDPFFKALGWDVDNEAGYAEAFNNRTEKSSHDEIENHVDNLIRMQIEREDNKIPTNTDQIDSRIRFSEEKIDKIVYQLYGLSDSEIEIIEYDNRTSTSKSLTTDAH